MTIIYEINNRIKQLLGFGDGWLLEYVNTKVNRLICDDDGRVRIVLGVVITLAPYRDNKNEPSQDNPNL